MYVCSLFGFDYLTFDYSVGMKIFTVIILEEMALLFTLSYDLCNWTVMTPGIIFKSLLTFFAFSFLVSVR